ncbi:Peroxidase 4 [Glycine max]|nr:Peroxidase 4 [Glycine max]
MCLKRAILEVRLGRMDSKIAHFTVANTGVIPPPTSNLTNLMTRFRDQGLCYGHGAHTFGKGRCTSFGYCIYNQTNNDKTFALTRQRRCPRTNGTGDNNLENLDLRTPNHFDNNYFKNLLIERGLLNSNQVFFNGGSTDSLIKIYSQNNKAFDT